jgi:RimJ/RimL family protein N-acetyltransferase
MTIDRQPILSGALVALRPLRTDDLPALQAVASDPRIWEQHPAKDRIEPTAFGRWFDEALASGGALTVIDQGDHNIIGSSRFDHFDRSRSEIEIGWTFIARSYWGGTYNGELKQLMLRHAFGSVRNVVFKIHSENMRSRRAVEKLGAIGIAMEPDAEGRGGNCVYRLERTAYFDQAEPSARC